MTRPRAVGIPDENVSPNEARRQIAALPVRLDCDRRLKVCLITSRGTRRWIVPKGWPMRGLLDHEAAAVEALEEAGLRGKALSKAIGSYHYWRRTRTDFRLTKVATFLLRVKTQKADWKEKNERSQCWLPLLEAADYIEEPELSSLIVGLPGNERACRFIGQGEPFQF